MKTDLNSKTFCIAPWHDVHVITDGTFKGCCVMNHGEVGGRLLTDGKVHTVAKDGINGAMNSDTSKELRLDMLQGKWHTNCTRCKNEESSGMRSMRQLYGDRWKDFTQVEAEKITNKETGEIPVDHKPFYYDIQLGNLCNLKCRICNPLVSSAWIPDYMKMMRLGDKANIKVRGGKDPFSINIEHVKGKQYNITPNPFAWAESDEFWEQMSAIKGEIEHLYLIGGEPMMIHRHFKFLEECVESGDASHITLQYDTNLTNIPEKVMGYWSHFKSLMIGFSIDGMGPELEYMRHPVKWNHILRNINRVEEFAKNNHNVKLNDSITISTYNVLHILDFIEWKVKAGKYDFDYLWQWHDDNFCAHPLHGPDFLCVKTMPLSAKKYVTQKYYEWRDKMIEWCDSIDEYSGKRKPEDIKEAVIKFVDRWVEFINQEDWSHRVWKFWEYTNDLDNVRGENFQEVFPELAKIMNDYPKKPHWFHIPTNTYKTE